MALDETILDAVRMSLVMTLKVSGPILAAGLLIGLLVSIVQAVTQIQEQTLVFVPKIAAMLVVSLALLSWIVQRVAEFAAEMFTLSV